MRRSLLLAALAIACVGLILAQASPSVAAGDDEIRKRERQAHVEHLERAIIEHQRTLKQLEDESARAREAGNDDAVEALRRETAQVAERLHDLQREVLQHELDTKVRLREPDAEHREHPELHEAAQRLEHLLQAVEHLERAGLHDAAAELAERSEHMRRELEERHRHHEHGGEALPGHIQEIHQAVAELRHSVNELRAEVRELREQVQALRGRE